MKSYFYLLPALCLFLFSGCETYHLTTESMLKQFANSEQQTKVNVLIAPPFFFYPGIVDGNSLKTITVTDNKGQEKVLKITNRTGVRFTKTDGKKTTFYFDTMILKDSTVSGCKTHFVNARIKPIKFADISKIELQK